MFGLTAKIFLDRVSAQLAMRKCIAPVLGGLVSFLSLAGGSYTAMGQSHSYYHSGHAYGKNFFVTQAVEGEYGRYSLMPKNGAETSQRDSIWRGFGIRNSFGLEVMQFAQFSLSHTFLNMRDKNDSAENLQGSRFSGDLRFVFAAPVGNLELGGGVIGSQYDYRFLDINSGYMGSGYYYSLGLNHYVSSRVSLFFYGKKFRETLVRSGGNTDIDRIRVDTNGISAGVKVWL